MTQPTCAHVQINGHSWCQCYGIETPAMYSLARKRRVSMCCQHESRESAERMALFLREHGQPAVVVDGPCHQRDDPDLYDI